MKQTPKQANSPSKTSVRIPNIGNFTAISGSDGSISHYSARVSLSDIGTEEVEVILLPNRVGPAFRPEQKTELGRRYRKFEKLLVFSLKMLPYAIRYLCLEYEFDISDLSDNQIRDGLKWQTIYLRRNGQIECLTKHDGINGSLDIMVRFNRESRLVDAYFDG